jgi:carbamoyl-phosphate synthase large subunit
VPIIGTAPDMIDLAEDRERFQKLLDSWACAAAQPHRPHRRGGAALAREIGYPLVVRPSYVLGGRAMEIVTAKPTWRYMREAVKVSNDSPVLLDRFLDDAIECDVDMSPTDGNVLIGGVMEHIEQAGVHSGDGLLAAAVLAVAGHPGRAAPPGGRAGQGLNVVGLMNVQFAIQHEDEATTSSICWK